MLRYMKVSAIVVTYNRLDLLKKCLKNITNQTYSVNNIFVINNNSHDGTKQYLSKIQNHIIKPINLNKNLGGAGGFCLGIKSAFERTNSNYFWIMDDDAMPEKDALYKLVRAAQLVNNDFGFLCSNVRWWKDHRTLNVPIPSKDWDKLMPKYKLAKVNRASFVSFLTSRSVVKELGLPISKMFIWGDDYEYTTRISNKYSSYYVLDSIVIHNSSVSNGNETIYNTHRIHYYYYLYRNILYTMRKHRGFKKTIRQLLLDVSNIVEIPFLSKDNRLKRLWYVILGVLNGLFLFNPKIKYPK